MAVATSARPRDDSDFAGRAGHLAAVRSARLVLGHDRFSDRAHADEARSLLSLGGGNLLGRVAGILVAPHPGFRRLAEAWHDAVRAVPGLREGVVIDADLADRMLLH